MNKERIVEILMLVITKLNQTAELPNNLIVSSGICSIISRLQYIDGLITMEERLVMRSLVMNNKPDDKQFTSFTQGKYWTGNTFWWTPIAHNKETAYVRATYIRTLIIKINETIV